MCFLSLGAEREIWFRDKPSDSPEKPRVHVEQPTPGMMTFDLSYNEPFKLALADGLD